MPFSTTPFPQLALGRAGSALDRVGERVWKKLADIEVQFAGSFDRPVPFERVRDLEFQKIPPLPFEWGLLFDEGWFELKITDWPKNGWLGWFDDGEGTLYAEGFPIQGFDVAHRYGRLPESRVDLFVHGLCLQSAIWHPEARGLGKTGSRLREAAVFERDEAAWTLWNDLKVLCDLAAHGIAEIETRGFSGTGHLPPLQRAAPWLRRLLRGLDRAVDALEQQGDQAAIEICADLFKELSGGRNHAKAVLVGHSHIDLVWLWPARVAGFKACHTWASMLGLMKDYPEFRFSFSQPALLEDVELLHPGLGAEIRAKTAEGRWEFLGAAYLEMDVHLPAGEPLLRNLLIGQKEFAVSNGAPSRVLWLPDAFGYPACLPQMMRLAGVDGFFTTKLGWSRINAFPYTSFVWKGADGSSVASHVLPARGYNQSLRIDELVGGMKEHVQSDVHRSFLAPTGHGDGGGGATPEMCERARRMRSLEGLPAVEWGLAEDFFKDLLKIRAHLPEWQGELFLERHQGTFTTHGNVKFAYRRAETALQCLEAARCATNAGPVDPAIWKRLFRAQFHDLLPGSAIHEVYEEALPDLESLAADATTKARMELEAACGGEARDCVFNPLPMPLLVLQNGRIFEYPPLSGIPMRDAESALPKKRVRTSPGSLRSEKVAVRFAGNGAIERLEFDGHRVPLKAGAGLLCLHVDRPQSFEAWDIDRHTLAAGVSQNGLRLSAVEGDGSIVGSLSFTGPIGKRSRACLRYSVDALRACLFLDIEIDWREEHALLRMEFPTEFQGRMARFGSPFGSVLRGQQPGETMGEAMHEGPASRWMSIGDDGGGAGLSVVCEAKYGFSCRDGAAGVSLVRSVHVTGEDWQHRHLLPAHLRRGGVRPAFSDHGIHRIRLALAPTAGGNPAALAETLFAEPLRYSGEAVSCGFVGIQNGHSVVPCWAKPADDGAGWILRLHETLGYRGRLRIRTTADCFVSRSDAMEERKGRKVNSLDFRPYEILSCRFTPRTA